MPGWVAHEARVDDADLDAGALPAGVVPEVRPVGCDALAAEALDFPLNGDPLDARASGKAGEEGDGHGGRKELGAGGRRRECHSVLPQVRRHVARTGGGQQYHDGDERVAVHRRRAGGGVAALVAGDELVQPVVEGVVTGRVELAAEGLDLLDAGTRDRGGGLGPLRRMRIPFGAGRQQDDDGGHGHEGGRSPAAGRSRRSAAGRGAASVIVRSDAHGTCLFL